MKKDHSNYCIVFNTDQNSTSDQNCKPQRVYISKHFKSQVRLSFFTHKSVEQFGMDVLNGWIIYTNPFNTSIRNDCSSHLHFE